MAPQVHVVRDASSAIPPPLPEGLNYIASIRIAVRDLLIAHSFSVLLVALLVALLYFSTAQSRRRPLFLLNVFTILLALSVGALIDYQTIQTMIAPLDPTPLSFNIAIGVLGAIQSILVDTILLVRLISVFPRTSVGARGFYSMLVIPVLLKVARIINLIIFIKALADATKNPATAIVLVAQIWEGAPYLKIEWFAQLFDNTYASAGFLYRLALHRREHDRVMSHKTAESSFADTVRTLFWVAATNFVVPVLFSLVQIIVVYRDVNVFVVNDIVLVNTSIAVIGVVFATVWAGTTHWTQTQTRTVLDTLEPSRIVFEHGFGMSEGSVGRVGDAERTELPLESRSFTDSKAQ